MNNLEFLDRRSIRLKGYDYSNAGYYHVTICSNNRLNIFGSIKEHQVALSLIKYRAISKTGGVGSCLTGIPYQPHPYNVL